MNTAYSRIYEQKLSNRNLPLMDYLL